MAKKWIVRIAAVVLTAVLCVTPFYAMRHVGRRLPDNPLPSAVQMPAEPAEQPAEEISEAAAEAEAEAEEDLQMPLPDLVRQAVPQREQAVPSSAQTKQSLPSGTAPNLSVYGFAQNGRITSANTVQRQPKDTAQTPTAAAVPSPQPVRVVDSSDFPQQTTAPAPEEPAEKTPKLVTDLPQYTVVRQGELENHTLRFSAYGTDGENLSVEVRVREKDAASAALLRSADGRTYAFPMTLGKTYLFYVTLFQNGSAFASPAVFSVTYRADLADQDHPNIGGGVSLFTNLDYLRDGDRVKTSALTLKVTARTVPDGQILYADQIEVRLDGVVQTSVGGGENPEYDFLLQPPNVGQSRTYTLEALAWNGADSVYWSRTIEYQAAAEGSVVGTAAIALDATTLGLDVPDEAEIQVIQGETAAHAVLRFLEDFGYTVTYDGTVHSGFYIRAISRAGLCEACAVPEELRRMLRLDGVPLHTAHPDGDTIAERDFTSGSGWMFAVNGVVYERGLSAMTLHDGDVLSLRFTLAWGKDVGGAPVSGSGNLKSYCGVWADGTYTPIAHVPEGEPVVQDGAPNRFRCANCGQLFTQTTEEHHANDDTAGSLFVPGTVPAALQLYTKRRIF